MKSRNLILIIAILIVLIAIYLIQNLTSSRKTISESLSEIFPDFNTSNVASIMIYKQGYQDSGLVFAKKDGRWVIGSYYDSPAKESDIDKILQDIKSLKGEIRSARAELFGDYEISDSLALHIDFLGPDSSLLAGILVGKGVPQAARLSFVRKLDNDTVYMATENLVSRFAVWNAEPWKRLPEKRWLELKMVDEPKEQIKTIEIKADRKDYRFAREDKISDDTLQTKTTFWTQIEPTKGMVLDDKAIQDILNRISSLRGTEIVGVEALPEYGLQNARYRSGFTTDDGRAAAFIFGAESDTTSGARYAMVDGQPYIYKVAKFNFESLFVNPFKKEK